MDNDPQSTSIPESSLIWYSIKDRYSLDFESIPRFIDNMVNLSLQEPDLDKEQLTHLITIATWLKTCFDNQFKIIKGDHILHNMDVQKNPTLNPIDPLLYTPHLNTDYVEVNVGKRKDGTYNLFYDAQSILDIIRQNTLYNNDDEKLKSNPEAMHSLNIFLSLFHYFKGIFENIQKELEDKIINNPPSSNKDLTNI